MILKWIIFLFSNCFVRTHYMLGSCIALLDLLILCDICSNVLCFLSFWFIICLVDLCGIFAIIIYSSKDYNFFRLQLSHVCVTWPGSTLIQGGKIPTLNISSHYKFDISVIYSLQINEISFVRCLKCCFHPKNY